MCPLIVSGGDAPPGSCGTEGRGVCHSHAGSCDGAGGAIQALMPVRRFIATGTRRHPCVIHIGFPGQSACIISAAAGETEWTVLSSWSHPSFQVEFLPDESEVTADGFSATYRITNLALSRLLVSTGSPPGEGEQQPWIPMRMIFHPEIMKRGSALPRLSVSTRRSTGR